MNQPIQALAKALLCAAAIQLTVGCTPTPTPTGSPPPVEVGYLELTPTSVTLTRDLPGRVVAHRTAEVRARINGVIEERLFEEGALVTAGQPLFRIESAPFAASLASAQAELARAKANVDAAEVRMQRQEELLPTKAISQQDFDDALAELNANRAAVLAAQAGVQTAEINLGYTNVVAPIAGRIGRAEVTEGAYVQASSATLLATIRQLDPVYVDVTQASAELLALRRDLASGQLETDAAGRARVQLFMEDGSAYPVEGALTFVDATVDPSTSTVTQRALFPNPDGHLLPGMFVRARIVQGQQPDALLVPQLAVQRDTTGAAFVYLVNAKDVIERRVVDVPRTVGNQWLVASGLQAGDRLVVDNLQRVREGAQVKPVPAELPDAYMSPTQER